MATFSDALRWEIEERYQHFGCRAGWRLLYSPPHVLDGATVAFIGLNPGGDHAPQGHPDFAPIGGSAYEDETWADHSAGDAPLQRQVRRLFHVAGAEPTDVLAGNLVPFRSPTWASMPRRREALDFVRNLWERIIERAKPRLVITMGRACTDQVAGLLQLGPLRGRPAGWGRARLFTGERGDRRMIGLPHLSRFQLMGREPSETAVQETLRWAQQR
ncbi:MAG: uracil-DNA glycosylase family protein [Pseudomonadota bacterium]